MDGNFCSGDIKKDKEESVMDKEVTLKGKTDSELKEQAELSYKHLSVTEAKRILGIANGKYKIPDDIDECNNEITEMFEMKKI